MCHESWIDDGPCICGLIGSLSEAEQERDELRAAAAGAEKDAEGAKEEAKQLWDKIQARVIPTVDRQMKEEWRLDPLNIHGQMDDGVVDVRWWI